MLYSYSSIQHELWFQHEMQKEEQKTSNQNFSLTHQMQNGQ
ncbi:hypothetical protein VCEM1676A_002872 [Vibrio cholerae O1 str. EM-1676A]|nr:hypothetical protein VCEM1676A_002872 [Vibrio cholerae O1 str. EM-1676A]GHY50686.1 hypothetical protein VCSRO119_2157 [Vibrio cholerae]GHZ38189.1 hypothetical protein VCSRO3_2028 [Vibrio cholerae]GIA57423.1 hypothetical protein VCSRO87_1835 [Vibrio cholerae]GIB54906.1 hypothetical protein VCSRO140_1939 [Vibrio cholerae]